MRMLRFEGATMRDALARVKAELGDRAVIFSTRQVRRGLLGTAVEVSAAIEDDALDGARADAVPDAERGDERTGPMYGGPMSAPSGGGIAGALAGTPGPTTWAQGGAGRARYAAGGLLPSSSPSPAPAAPPPELEQLIGPLKSELRSLRAMVRASGADSRREAEIKAEIAALRRVVEDLRAAPAPAAHAGAGPAAADDAAADADADRAAAATAPGAPGAALTAPSRGRILLFVGPTGAGKTTTIAKLAASAALALGTRVHLITLDTYRVGGIDQIQTFADLIGIPLAVAESPAALAGKLDPAAELTLIDTAGRSPRDTSSIAELAAALPGLPPIEVHLVVPAAAAAAAIDELAARYRALRPARLLFTKLDEVEHARELAHAPARTGLPITWITTGQAVPEDIEQPTAPRLRELARAGLGPSPARSGRAA